MTNPAATQAEKIELSMKYLRHAIEDGAYERAQLLLVEQNMLFAEADLNEDGMRELAMAAQRINQWALTMTKLQRSRMACELSELERIKEAELSYAMVRPRRTGFVEIKG